MQEIMLKFEVSISKDVVLLIQDFAWGPTTTTTTSADWDAAIQNEGGGDDINTRRFFDACSRGHTAIADWALAQVEHMAAFSFTNALVSACRNGHLATAKWLVAQDWGGGTRRDRCL